MTDSQHSIKRVNDLYSFFHSELTKALQDLKVDTSEETEAYLIHLLEGYVRLNPTTAGEIGFRRPAAMMLGDALQSGGDRRIEAYRRLGDASLFSCGFFEEYLNRSRSPVKSDYYRSMGRNAYQNLQDLMAFKAPGSVFHTIYRDLARKFDLIVDAFRVLAGKDRSDSVQRMLARWQGGEALSAAEWTRLGVLPGWSKGTDSSD